MYLTAALDPAPTYDRPLQIVVPATIHLFGRGRTREGTHSVSESIRGVTRRRTHCRAVRGVDTSHGTSGATVVAPTRTSCRKVLYLEIVVGCTDADGIEKSQ